MRILGTHRERRLRRNDEFVGDERIEGFSLRCITRSLIERLTIPWEETEVLTRSVDLRFLDGARGGLVEHKGEIDGERRNVEYLRSV